MVQMSASFSAMCLEKEDEFPPVSFKSQANITHGSQKTKTKTKKNIILDSNFDNKKLIFNTIYNVQEK